MYQDRSENGNGTPSDSLIQIPRQPLPQGAAEVPDVLPAHSRGDTSIEADSPPVPDSVRPSWQMAALTATARLNAARPDKGTGLPPAAADSGESGQRDCNGEDAEDGLPPAGGEPPLWMLAAPCHAGALSKTASTTEKGAFRGSFFSGALLFKGNHQSPGPAPGGGGGGAGFPPSGGGGRRRERRSSSRLSILSSLLFCLSVRNGRIS